MRYKKVAGILLIAAAFLFIWASLPEGEQPEQEINKDQIEKHVDQYLKQQPLLMIGVIDIEQIYDESGRIDYFRQMLEEKSQQLEEQFENEKDELSEDEKIERQDELYQEFMDAQEEVQGYLEAEVEAAIDEVSQQMELDLIFDHRYIRHGGQDITSEVIQKLKEAEPVKYELQ